MRNDDSVFNVAIMAIAFVVFISILATLIIQSNINVPANYICTDTRTERVYMGNSEKYYSKDQTLIIYNTDGSELVLAGEFVCEFNEQDK